MRVALFTLALVSALGSDAMASSKVCFGSKNNDDTKGVVLLAQISRQEITLKTIKGGLEYNGTYPSLGTKVNGRDGKTYLEYEGENPDYQDIIMVDKDLLKGSTTGLLQIRARGEGFFNSVFFCKDADE